MPQPVASKEPIQLFYSYSHKDYKLRDELETHLAVLQAMGVIDSWDSRKIGAGKNWEGEVSAHLNAAHVILLLISPDFIASIDVKKMN